ncbi:PSP1 C-terminal conserved region-domain-containing protein [Fomitopsis serialis]|uniref:PSP1 C-terminal conserved region-domain-containing protein n=1 Tax=Fomitopsis serialis TaxID=139415 RepID=UPI002007BF20|nr:PSP1 C-terminal conserved region-domain-containing protein [Neoantrodia serialis]KAH9920308.1 PSP1 C-terminal conserved region-domain-containing protein [Neoantrodia serialis]
MASTQGNHQQYSSDDADRKNRFLSDHGTDSPNSLRERAASQPPRSTSQGFTSSPVQPTRNPSGTAWPRLSGLNPNSINGALPSSVPTRSVSFSSSPPSLAFSSAMRDSRFASTFEDDESEALSDIQDYDPYDPYIDDPYRRASMSNTRGRTYAADLTRSRSQSLATARPGALGGSLSAHGPSGLWSHNSLSGAKDIPGSRYGDLKPPGSSRYGSLGALGRSSSSGYGSITDPSNMSPFRRDVGQILLDDGSAFRELGTTSRRHSVSVVQPRRPTIVGFNAPGGDGPEEMSRPGPFHSASFAGGGGLLLTDDDLASDLNMLNLRDEPRTSSSMQPPSQPSSLPIYAPLSRSPPSADRLSPYQPLHLNIPGNSYVSRQSMGSPSESGLSGGSPGRGHLDSIGRDSGYASLSGETSRQATQLARFIPGQGIQNIPEQSMLQTPLSPVGVRASHYAAAPQMQRRGSDAAPGKAMAELGRGVPLHAVPTSWPLYIVEFKAGRTDLFYSTDVAPDIRAGDLVIVEADRGKDLGKVINDTITLAEVEAFQKQQKLMNYADVHGTPTSPTASAPPAGKEINPKRIYCKAQPQDTQVLATKLQDENKALELCRNKVRQRKLPMEVVDAEYQWDRRKLTFYFVAEKRIDFRELVRELFRLYKTRIWMASLGGPGGYEQ